jgi:hypothetical protein
LFTNNLQNDIVVKYRVYEIQLPLNFRGAGSCAAGMCAPPHFVSMCSWYLCTSVPFDAYWLNTFLGGGGGVKFKNISKFGMCYYEVPIFFFNIY